MPFKRRSNRPLTQFACGCLDLFLQVDDFETDRSKGNTSVKCYREDNNVRIFQVALDGQKILEAVFFNNTPITVALIFSEQFKSDEHFRSIAIERLNGLLDALSFHEIIPEGVRVFRDRDANAYFIGKDDNKESLAGLNETRIIIHSHHSTLCMLSKDAVLT